MRKKGEARIARELKQELKQKEKSARLVARIKAEMPEPKAIRLGANPASIYNMPMTWTVEDADRQGDWSWGPRDWDKEHWNNILAPKLVQFQTMLWREIEAAVTDSGHRMHHSMPVDAICDESQARLIELEKAESDDIYRFRLGNKRRLWGFRIVNSFEVLWYDPLHKIYPTD